MTAQGSARLAGAPGPTAAPVMIAQGSAAHQAPQPIIEAWCRLVPAGACRRVPASSKMLQIGVPGRQNP